MGEKRPKYARLLGVIMVNDVKDTSMQVTQYLDCRLLQAHLAEPTYVDIECVSETLEMKIRTVVS